MGSQLPFSHILCFQAPEASNQALVSASSEWQQKLEAAEALLALRESSPAPSGCISLLQPCVAPGSLVFERRTRGWGQLANGRLLW